VTDPGTPRPVPAPLRPVPGPPRPVPAPAVPSGPDPATVAQVPTGPDAGSPTPFERLAERPVADHVAVYEAEHERLQRELSTIDQL
jgi:hypothetical protein